MLEHNNFRWYLDNFFVPSGHEQCRRALWDGISNFVNMGDQHASIMALRVGLGVRINDQGHEDMAYQQHKMIDTHVMLVHAVLAKTYADEVSFG